MANDSRRRFDLRALLAGIKKHNTQFDQQELMHDIDEAAAKIRAIRTADYFAERAARADMQAFDRLMKRAGGEPPRPGDEMPQD